MLIFLKNFLQNQVFRSPLYQPNTKPRLSARMLLGYTSKENTGSPLVS
ncbi:hypothetical protein [Moraxella lacunata]